MRLLSLLAMLGAVPAAAQDFPATVVDQANQQVTVQTAPQRVFCLAMDCLQNLAVLGVVPIGGPDTDVVPTLDPAVYGAKGEAIVQMLWDDIVGVEAVLALEPDLFVGTVGSEDYIPISEIEAVVPVYTARGPYADKTALDYSNDDDWNAFVADLRNLGTILGRPAEAESYIARARDRIAAYDRLVDESARLGIVRLWQADKSISLPNSCGFVLSALAQCVTAGPGWRDMTAEGLLSIDPDVLVVEDYVNDVDLACWSNVPLWTELSAVKDNRVHLVSANQALDYSPLSVVLSLDTIMPLLYPDIFPDGPLTDEQVAATLAR